MIVTRDEDNGGGGLDPMKMKMKLREGNAI